MTGRTLLIAAVALLGAGGTHAVAEDQVAAWNALGAQAAVMAGQTVPASRTLAIAQIAVHDALNAIEPRYQRYAFHGRALADSSVDAAIATAAHDALVGAIGTGVTIVGFGTLAGQAAAVALLNARYSETLVAIPNGLSKTHGVAIGAAAAAAILALRSTDHAFAVVQYTPGTRPGDWQPTPNPVPFDPPAAADRLAAVLPGWGQVTPFALRSSDQFEPKGPPRLSGPAFARDYNEVKEIGEQNSASRTTEQTSIARFWFEGSPAGWSRIARIVAEAQALDPWQRARLLALANIAMADGFIAGFGAKYDFNSWRPVTAIRAGDTDGNDDTVADVAWNTLLNTPAHPDYPSTHSVLGGAAAEVLRRFFGDDDIAFTTTSGAPFAGLTRSYNSFSEAARENGESRIYAGVHFRSAVEDGMSQGRKIGAYVFTHVLKRLDSDDEEEADRDRRDR